MSSSRKNIGVMLTENHARIAVVEPSTSGVVVTAVAHVALPPDAEVGDRLALVGDELRGLGCGRRTRVWVACSLPEMQFASLSIKRMAPHLLGPMAWMNFRKEVGNLPEKVIFDYEVLGSFDEGLEPMWNLTAFASPYEELEQIKSWFEPRFSLQGITMGLFADRNLVSLSAKATETVALLSFDEHISRIMVIRDGRTMFTRTIKAGSGVIVDFAKKKLNRSVSLSEIKAVLKPAVLETPALLGDEQRELQQTCKEGANRFFTQVDRVFDYYTRHLKRELPKTLLLTGDTDFLLHAIPELKDRFGLRVDLLDPQSGAIRYSPDVAELLRDEGEGAQYSSTIGVAMSGEDRTPNLICTQDVKERLLKIRRVQSIISWLFILLAVILFGGLVWQRIRFHAQGKRLSDLEQRYAEVKPLLTREEADARLVRLQRMHVDAKLLVTHNKVTAALGEVLACTPSEFRIKTFKVDGGDDGFFVLDGVVLERVTQSENCLAKYVVDLNASPLFSQVSLTSESTSEEPNWLQSNGILPFAIKGQLVEDPVVSK